jgi:hypothetical protein
MHALHGALYSVLILATGMSDNDIPAGAYVTGALLDLTYCYICAVLLSSIEAQRIHNRSVVHIMRSLKLMGKAIVMCVDCRKFVLLSADEHCGRHYHRGRRAMSGNTGPSLQVVRFQRGLATDEQLAQLEWNEAHFRAYHDHQVLHLGLFLEYQRGEDAIRRHRVLGFRARRRAVLDQRAWADRDSYHAHEG